MTAPDRGHYTGCAPAPQPPNRKPLNVPSKSLTLLMAFDDHKLGGVDATQRDGLVADIGEALTTYSVAAMNDVSVQTDGFILNAFFRVMHEGATAETGTYTIHAPRALEMLYLAYCGLQHDRDRKRFRKLRQLAEKLMASGVRPECVLPNQPGSGTGAGTTVN